jgi:phage-related baseplate assembly protein
MNPFNAIDLSKLPAPSVVEVLDFEVILAEMLDDLRERLPDYTNTLESDPVYKILEVAAYREMLLRARINDASRSVMLAFARSSNLDQLAAFYGVERLVIEAGDESVIPPRLPVLEDDERFRRRVQLRLEGYTTAGPRGAYSFHAMTADPRVKDVDVDSPSPGEVLITILSNEGDGVPTDDLLLAVNDYLNADTLRPLTDFVTVQAPTLKLYRVVAELDLLDGPDSGLVQRASQQNTQDYLSELNRLGQDITLSGLYAALHTEGVARVNLLEPLTDIAIASHEVGVNDFVSITLS